MANSRKSKQAPDATAEPEDAGTSAETTEAKESQESALEPGETDASSEASAESNKPADTAVAEPAETPDTERTGAIDAKDDMAPHDTTAPNARQQGASAQPAPSGRRGGFLGTVLGGIVAAVIGFGTAQYIGPDGWPFDTGTDDNAAFQTLEQRIGDLSDRMQDVETSMTEVQTREPTPVPMEELTARIDSVETDLGARMDALSAEIGSIAGQIEKIGTRLDGIDARLTAVEKRPIAQADSTEISSAVAAYEKQLEAMRNELAAQRDRNADLADEVAAAARSATTEIANAVENARALQKRAALMRVRAALDSGTGFATSLTLLEDVGVPPTLRSVAESGVPTLDELRQGFAEPARTALAASLRETAGGDTGDRLAAFLRTQLGARSLTPREGNDPGAILSRAEAALRDGRVRTALDEIATLPRAGQDAMADWVAQAESRLQAIDAVEALAASLNSN